LTHWLVSRKTVFISWMLISASNVGMMNFLWSGLFTQFTGDVFLMPLKKQDANVLTSGKIISVLMEDLPFLYIQYAVFNDAREDDTSTKLASLLALVFSLTSIFVAIASYLGRFGSDHKSLRRTYVLIRNPKDSLLMHNKSMIKKFEKHGFHDSYAWITVAQQSDTDFRLCYEYTHVPDISLQNAIIKSLEDYSTKNTQILIEQPPKVSEFIEDISELAHLLEYNGGRLILENLTEGVNEMASIHIHLTSTEHSILYELRNIFGAEEIQIQDVVNQKIEWALNESIKFSPQFEDELALRSLDSMAESYAMMEADKTVNLDFRHVQSWKNEDGESVTVIDDMENEGRFEDLTGGLEVPDEIELGNMFMSNQSKEMIVRELLDEGEGDSI